MPVLTSGAGTNDSSKASIENILRVTQQPLDERLNFIDSDAAIMDGFQGAWLESADDVLEQVRDAQNKYRNASIMVTGHSLGAAIALLDALRITHELSAPVNAILCELLLYDILVHTLIIGS